MTTPQSCDALVIGGGVNGLTAAAYLARGGKRTLLVEARAAAGGLCETAPLSDGALGPMAAHAFYALDPRVLKELKLARHGLKFSVRDAPLSLLRGGADRLVLTRDVRASARSIATHSKSDAEAWPRYRNEMFALGRTMRALWWNANGKFVADGVVERIARTGAAAWLDSWFESDALKALLAFNASLLSPLESGSALLLLWRAAQEMCGLQAAVAFAAGGPGALVTALMKACEAAGVEIRTNAEVTELAIQGGRVVGARLSTGDGVTAPLVLSSLSRHTSLSQLANRAALGLAERRALNDKFPIAEAKIVLALDGLPEVRDTAGAFNGGLIFAERLESYVLAHADARAGRIPQEPIMEVTIPSIADPDLAPQGKHVASVLVRSVPREIPGGWSASKATFAAKALAQLDSRIPGLVNRVIAAEVLTPEDLSTRYHTEAEDLDVSRMLAPWPQRVQTPIENLFLCGADADVAPAISGRAGRIAATIAIGKH